MAVIDLVELGYIPDWMTRIGVRYLLKHRLRKETMRLRAPDAMQSFLEEMYCGPLALNTLDANQQHYEVPTKFFDLCLGEHKKYSCALFAEAVNSLSGAEESMLNVYLERADIKDNQTILELGCGWGSLTLWMAKRFPTSKILAVSNSSTQKIYIDEQARLYGLDNIEVVTCDMNVFDTAEKFDRVISIEMFEHMRNHKLLYNRISGWLKADGQLFFHIFCHRSTPYFFEQEGKADWMATHFFSGGLMPSYDLPLQVDSALRLQNRWSIDGTHYALTARAWLTNLDLNRRACLDILEASQDPTNPIIQLNRWRMFFIACEELFGYKNGKQWHIGHYLFRL